MLETWIVFIFGMFIGILATVILSFRLFSGVLRVDQTNPEKDVYRLEISNLDAIPTRKYIILEVDKNAHLSQE